MCMNITTNIIGVGNAATVNGIKAIKSLHEDNNKNDLKNKLEKIVSDRMQIPKMGAAGYQHVKECFQFKNYYEQIEKILGKMDLQ